MAQTEIPQKIKPKLFFGWYLVAGSFITNLALTGTYFQGFQVFFLPILTTFGWSRTALSGVFTLRQLESGLIAPILGFLVDRLGPRTMITMGGALAGLGFIILSHSTSLFWFYVIFLFASIGASGASHGITWPVIIAKWFRRKLGMALGIATMGPFLSGVPVMITTWLVMKTDWQTTMTITGFSLLIIIIPIGIMVRNSPEPYGLLPDGETPDRSFDDNPYEKQESSISNGLSVRQAVNQKSFWLNLVFFGAFFFGNSGFGVHQIPFFESRGLSTSEAASTLTILLLLSGIGRLGGGILADYFEIHYILGFMAVLNLITWLYLILVDTNTLFIALPFTLIHGIAFGFGVSLRPVIVTRLFGTQALGAINGLFQTGMVISGVIGPVLMGRIFDVTGEYTQALYYFSVVAALLIPLTWIIRVPKP